MVYCIIFQVCYLHDNTTSIYGNCSSLIQNCSLSYKLTKNHTWKLVSLPPNKKGIDVRRVFKVKEGPNGGGLRYKLD